MILTASGIIASSNPRAAAYDADFQAKLDRATALGYTLPSGIFLTAENNLYLNLKDPSRLGLSSSNLYTKTQEFYLHNTNGDANYNTLRGKAPLSAAATLRNSPTFTSGEGFTGNGTSSDISYGAPSGLYTQNSAYALSIVHTWGTNRSSTCVNGTTSSGAANSLWFRLQDARCHVNTTSFLSVSSAARLAKTIIMGAMTGGTTIAYAERQGIAGTTTYSSGAVTAANTPTDGLFALSTRGASAFSTAKFSAMFYGQGLTQTESEDLIYILANFLTEIGW